MLHSQRNRDNKDNLGRCHNLASYYHLGNQDNLGSHHNLGSKYNRDNLVKQDHQDVPWVSNIKLNSLSKLREI